MHTVSLFDERHLGEKHLFKSKGMTGCYYLTGNPKAQPVIILHGLTGNHIGLLPIAAHLSQYRCILPDLPGHGASPVPHNDATLGDLADWLLEFIKQWEGAIVVTHSYSGSLAMLALCDSPQSVSGCVLMNPVADVSGLARSYRRIIAMLRPTISAMINDIRALRDGRQVYLLERITPEVMQVMEQLNIAEESLKTSREQMGYFQKLGLFFDDPSIFGSVPKELAKKTYCIVGTRDPLVSKQNNKVLQGIFGKSHVKACEPSGHLMPVEAFDDTAKIIKKLLKRITGPAATFKRRLARKP